MACLKCGKKTKDEQSFCRHCLEVMEAYPVDADVHIQLPHRPVMVDTKKTSRKRRILSAEEQISVLRRRMRRLAVVTLALTILLGAAVFWIAKDRLTPEQPPIGQNYSVGETFD